MPVIFLGVHAALEEGRRVPVAIVALLTFALAGAVAGAVHGSILVRLLAAARTGLVGRPVECRSPD
ncbi:MAG: hypothetical protein ACRD3M_00755 [Thermoanaerobaculia bacterium]